MAPGQSEEQAFSGLYGQAQAERQLWWYNPGLGRVVTEEERDVGKELPELKSLYDKLLQNIPSTLSELGWLGAIGDGPLGESFLVPPGVALWAWIAMFSESQSSKVALCSRCCTVGAIRPTGDFHSAPSTDGTSQWCFPTSHSRNDMWKLGKSSCYFCHNGHGPAWSYIDRRTMPKELLGQRGPIEAFCHEDAYRCYEPWWMDNTPESTLLSRVLGHEQCFRMYRQPYPGHGSWMRIMAAVPIVAKGKGAKGKGDKGNKGKGKGKSGDGLPPPPYQLPPPPQQQPLPLPYQPPLTRPVISPAPAVGTVKIEPKERGDRRHRRQEGRPDPRGGRRSDRKRSRTETPHDPRQAARELAEAEDDVSSRSYDSSCDSEESEIRRRVRERSRQSLSHSKNQRVTLATENAALRTEIAALRSENTDLKAERKKTRGALGEVIKAMKKDT